MSWMNAEQREHVRSLAALKPGERCGCGWRRQEHCRERDCPRPDLRRSEDGEPEPPQAA